MRILKKQRPIVILSWIAVIVWLILIFSLSAQPAKQSDGLSKKVTEVIIEAVDRVVPVDTEKNTTTDLLEKCNRIVRKNAHFFAYLVFGVLVRNVIKRGRASGFKAFALALGICILYAMSDEVHQLFVPGRGAQVMDVLIDSAGALVGIGMYEMAGWKR